MKTPISTLLHPNSKHYFVSNYYFNSVIKLVFHLSYISYEFKMIPESGERIIL